VGRPKGGGVLVLMGFLTLWLFLVLQLLVMAKPRRPPSRQQPQPQTNSLVEEALELRYGMRGEVDIQRAISLLHQVRRRGCTRTEQSHTVAITLFINGCGFLQVIRQASSSSTDQTGHATAYHELGDIHLRGKPWRSAGY